MAKARVAPRWLHTRFEVVKRGGGRSSVAGAAYNARAVLRDERTGELHDFRHAHQHEVVLADLGVALPAGAPEAWADRSVLWNEVERVERKADAQLCRRGDFSLPDILDDGELKDLARAIVADRVADGHVVDAVIHRGKNGSNAHLHIQEPLRACGAHGFLPKSENVYLVRNPETKEERNATAIEFRTLKDGGFEKIFRYRRDGKTRELTPTEAKAWAGCTRKSKTPVQRSRYLVSDWNDAKKAREWREAVARRTNEALDRHYDREGFPEGERAHVDSRSYAEQGIDRLPQLHEGSGTRAVEKRERSRCEQNGTAYEPVTDIAVENLRRRELNDAARRVGRMANRMEAARVEAAEWAEAWIVDNLSEDARLWYEAVERDRTAGRRSATEEGGRSLAVLARESRTASTALSGGEGLSSAQRIARRVAGTLVELAETALNAVLSAVDARWPEFALAIRDAVTDTPATAQARHAPIDDDLDGISDELESAASLAQIEDRRQARRKRTWSETPPRLAAVGTKGYETRKREFLGRLENAFGRYQEYCKEHEGTPFEKFHKFNGTIPEELRRDREVRARVSARLRDADELRASYASGVPAPQHVQAHHPTSQPQVRAAPSHDSHDRGRGGDAR